LGALAFWRFPYSRPRTLLRPLFQALSAGGVIIELIKDAFKGTEGPIGLFGRQPAFTETNDNRIVRIAPIIVSTFLETPTALTGLP